MMECVASGASSPNVREVMSLTLKFALKDRDMKENHIQVPSLIG
jgi:hypothetical protein